MKIFNEENGVKKVYVQVNDLSIIQEYEDDMPLYIFDIVINQENTTIDKNFGMGFLEFSRPEELDYFANCDWIIDYKKYRDYSIEQLEEEKKKIDQETDALRATFAGIKREERTSKEKELSRVYVLTYKKNYIDQLIAYKKGNLDIEFPLVPDSDAFCLTRDRSFPYEFRPSIDHSKILVYRKDGQTIAEDEEVPSDFIKKGISLMLAHRHGFYEESDYEVVNYMAPNRMYYVIDFRKKKKELENKKEEKGVMRLVHKLIGRKN